MDEPIEQRALARWRPGLRWYHPAMARVVIATSRFVMRRMNRLEIEGVERFESARARAAELGRGLLTYSNHVSLFDDPLLVSNFISGPYRSARWVGADAVNFFGSAPKAWLFTAGKSVPIVRGAGVDQPGMRYLADRLREGEWVHIFPEGGRSRDKKARLTGALKPGIGMMIAKTRPISLAFYHHGMHAVLPVGAVRPRAGNTVRVLFGAMRDWKESWTGPPDTDGEDPDLWQALAAEAWEELRRLEERVCPPSEGSGD